MNYKQFKLNNGTKNVVAPMKNTETASIFALVNTGSKYEKKKENGISHFLEHLFFKGTKNRPSANDIAKELDQIGGEYNAFTGKERTGFYIKVASKHFDLASEVLSDILINSVFSKKEIAKEKKIITQEINLYKDTPTEYIKEVFEKTLYGDQPAGRKVIGDKETIESFNREQIYDYFKNHYLSENTVISSAGNLSLAKVKKKVKAEFKNYRSGPKPKAPQTTEKQEGAQIEIHKKDTDQIHLALGVRTESIQSPNLPTLKVIASLLGKGMSSRLFNKIRQELEAAYYIKTEHQAYKDRGYLVTQAGVAKEKLPKVISKICREYQKLKDNRISSDELNKAKEYIKGKTLINLENSEDRAEFYGRQLLLKGEIDGIEEKFKKIDAVTPKKLQKISQDIFQDQKLNLALIGSELPESKLKQQLHL